MYRMSDECFCKKMYCQENNIEENSVFVVDDSDDKGVYLILPNRKRVYDFCKCNNLEYRLRIKKIRNDIKKKEIYEDKNFELLKLICTKIGLNIDDLIEEL